MRRGVGRGRGTSASLVVHAAVPSPASDGGLPKVGFSVPRAVGDAVVRNRVRRRLRALSRERLATWPQGLRLVIRALPPSATASYTALGADLDRACTAALSRARRSRGGTEAAP